MAEQLESKKNIEGFLIIFLGQIIFQICLFIKFRILISYLSVQNFGYYSLIIRFISVLVPLISFGIGNAFVVYIPYLTSKNIKITSFVKSSIKIQIIILIIFSLIFLFLPLILSDLTLLKVIFEFQAIVLFGVIISVINHLIYLYLISLRKIKIALFYHSLRGIFPLIITLIIFQLDYDSPLSSILWGNYVGSVIALMILLFIRLSLKTEKKESLNDNTDKGFIKRVFIEYNLFFVIYAVGYNLLNNIEPFIINSFLNIEYSAILSYFLTIQSMLFLGTVTIERLLTPIFSELCNDETNFSEIKKKKLTDFYNMGLTFALWVFILILLIFLDIASLFPTLIEFEKFGGDLTMIYAISLSGLFYVIAMVNITLLSARRKIREAAISINIINVLMIVLDIIFVPIWGFSGLIVVKIFINFGFLAITLFLNIKLIYIKKISKIIAIIFLNYTIQFGICFFDLNTNLYVLGSVNLLLLIFFFRNKTFREFLKYFFVKIFKNG